MTHMTALVGPAAALHSAGGELAGLPQGYVLATVGEDGWDAIGAVLAADPEAAGDVRRFLALLVEGAGVRAAGRFAYLEVGDGKQAAMVAEGAEVVASYTTELDGSQAGTPRGEWAVNRALREIGVRAAGAEDEYTALGLPR